MFGKLNVPDDKEKSGGEFPDVVRTKFKIGTETTGVFVGEPVEVYSHFEGEYPNGKYVGVCTGENCTICQDGNVAKYSMQINFLTVLDGTPTMTIAEGPKSLGKALRKKEEKKGDGFFKDTVVCIDRTDKTAFMIDDVKAPKGLENVKGLLKEIKTFDLVAMLEARVKKQTGDTDTTTTEPY